MSKAFGETLSRLYFDKFGIECLVIRICTAGQPGTPREASLWFNRDDLASLVTYALDIESLGHRTVFGISNNPNVFFFNGTDPRQPLDPLDPRHRLAGGVFAQWGHFDDRGE